jgi:hypothetical protein
MGSHVYRETAGYYDTLRPGQPNYRLGVQRGQGYGKRFDYSASLGQTLLQTVLGRWGHRLARKADQ